jgi:hypothetical protein
LNGNGDPGSQGIELDAYPTLRSLVIGAFKIYNEKIYISLFVVSAYFISGCSNDYLDVDQTETISTKDIVFNNDQGAATLSMQSIISFDFNMSSFSWKAYPALLQMMLTRIFPGDTGADKDLMDNLQCFKFIS